MIRIWAHILWDVVITHFATKAASSSLGVVTFCFSCWLARLVRSPQKYENEMYFSFLLFGPTCIRSKYISGRWYLRSRVWRKVFSFLLISVFSSKRYRVVHQWCLLLLQSSLHEPLQSQLLCDSSISTWFMAHKFCRELMNFVVRCDVNNICKPKHNFLHPPSYSIKASRFCPLECFCVTHSHSTCS